MAYEGTPASAFVDMDIVRRHLELAADVVANTMREEFLGGHDSALRYVPSLQFDSPLEVLFWLWWGACTIGTRYFEESIELRPQAEVTVGNQRFRVDFLVAPTEDALAIRPEWTPLAVELDGHAFHERTPEQVARRDQRDRVLQAAGWRVFHYSFQEFTRNPVDCTSEVIVFARAQFSRASMARYAEKHKNS